MSLGGNLTYNIKSILINSLSAKEFGVFTNTQTSGKELLFKQHGFSLPASTEVTTVTGSYGRKKIALSLLNANCPCNECNYEYGISLVRRVKNPGVLNSEYYPHVVTYSGVIEKVGCTDGKLNATIQQQIREDLIDQITNHVAWSKNGYDAVAHASVARILTHANQAMSINGQSITGQATVANWITAINNQTATTGVTAYALPTSATKIVLVGAPGDKSITIGLATLPTITIDANIYIALVQKEFDVTFEVEDPVSSFNTITIVTNAFSTNTPDDVFREFSQMKHQGALLSQIRADQPKNELYTKYIFKTTMKHAAIHGASHGVNYLKEIHVYIPTSELSGNKWLDGSYMAEAGSFDKTFADLLTFWKA